MTSTNLFASDELKQVDIVGKFWIKIPTDLSVNAVDHIVATSRKSQSGDISEMTANVLIILSVVKEWNFTKEVDGAVLELNEEVAKTLRYSLIDQILTAITENNEDLKAIIAKGQDVMAAEESLDKKKEDTAS